MDYLIDYFISFAGAASALFFVFSLRALCKKGKPERPERRPPDGFTVRPAWPDSQKV